MICDASAEGYLGFYVHRIVSAMLSNRLKCMLRVCRHIVYVNDGILKDIFIHNIWFITVNHNSVDTSTPLSPTPPGGLNEHCVRSHDVVEVTSHHAKGLVCML